MKKEFDMNNQTWIYAYTMMQRRYEEARFDNIRSSEEDRVYYDAFVKQLCSTQLPSGDGKFSRMVTYLESMVDFAKAIRIIWNDERSDLSFAFSFIAVTLERVLDKAKIIEKSR